MKRISSKPIARDKFEASEGLLVRMIARAILRDHLEQCGVCETDEKGKIKDERELDTRR